jgi:prevent-host-death family protein
MESIRPSADLRNHYNEISKECRETRQPVFITVNGRGDTVVLNYQEYRQMSAELELLRILAEGEDDALKGRIEPIENTFSGIRRKLLAGKRE